MLPTMSLVLCSLYETQSSLVTYLIVLDCLDSHFYIDEQNQSAKQNRYYKGLRLYIVNLML